LERAGSEAPRRFARNCPVGLTNEESDSKNHCMTKEEIKRRLNRKPFRPFVVKVAGGGQYPVPTGDHAHLHPNGRTLFVHLEDGGTEIIDVMLIGSLHTKEVA
jgi:hypothetical protein